MQGDQRRKIVIHYIKIDLQNKDFLKSKKKERARKKGKNKKALKNSLT